jgi:hypothetical protein
VDKIVITGNTYPHRETIKSLGGVWDKDRKAWIITIAGHPLNTMRGRGVLSGELHTLSKNGCRIEEE